MNFILLVPLILHYKLHLHLANQNWTEIIHIKDDVLKTLMSDLQVFLRRFKTPSRVATSGTRRSSDDGHHHHQGETVPTETFSAQTGTSESEIRARKTS